MSYWEDNLAALRAAYPALAESIAAQKGGLSGTQDSTVIKTENAASGAPTLIINGAGIHSTRDPVREAQKQAEALLQKASADSGSESAILILGFGLGYSAQAAALLAAYKGRFIPRTGKFTSPL